MDPHKCGCPSSEKHLTAATVNGQIVVKIENPFHRCEPLDLVDYPEALKMIPATPWVADLFSTIVKGCCGD